MEKFRTGGVDVAYELSGPSGGPGIVLIHGWTGDVGEWRTVTPVLNDAGWRTLGVDSPGFAQRDNTAAFSRELIRFLKTS